MMMMMMTVPGVPVISVSSSGYSFTDTGFTSITPSCSPSRPLLFSFFSQQQGTKMVITSLSDMSSYDCFSDVSGKKLKPLVNVCVFGIMMGQEVTIRSLLVLSLFLCTLSVVFLLGFVLVFFIVEI